MQDYVSRFLIEASVRVRSPRLNAGRDSPQPAPIRRELSNCPHSVEAMIIFYCETENAFLVLLQVTLKYYSGRSGMGED
jgi:hypothetical protein